MPGNRRCWTIEPEVTATARWVDLEQSSFLSSVGIFRSSQLSERPSMHETLLSHSGFSGGELESLCVHLPPPSPPWCPPLTRCRVDTQRRRGTCFPERALCVPPSLLPSGLPVESTECERNSCYLTLYWLHSEAYGEIRNGARWGSSQSWTTIFFGTCCMDSLVIYL